MRKILSESLFEYHKFTIEGDPVKDMQIGIEKLIKVWLNENKAISSSDYVITKEGTINTYNTVTLSKLGIEEFPEYINFEYVMGGFHCDLNKLRSLRGSPKIVSGAMICSNNRLENLEYAPREIKGDLIVSHNNINSLKGFPRIVEGLVSVSNNNLTNLEGIPSKINGNFYIHNNPIKTLKFFPDIIEGDLYYSESPILNKSAILKRCMVNGNLINKI